MTADITLTHDRAAAVNQSLHWLAVDKYPPPRSTKLLLINRRLGSAVLGSYTEGSGWTHWQALPKFGAES